MSLARVVLPFLHLIAIGTGIVLAVLLAMRVAIPRRPKTD
jgi:hypothetical protein